MTGNDVLYAKIIDGSYKVYRVAYMYMNIALMFALETKCWGDMFVSVYLAHTPCPFSTNSTGDGQVVITN